MRSPARRGAGTADPIPRRPSSAHRRSRPRLRPRCAPRDRHAPVPRPPRAGWRPPRRASRPRAGCGPSRVEGYGRRRAEQPMHNRAVDIPEVLTPRLLLRGWRDADREPFAVLNADPEVAAFLGGPIDRDASDATIDRFTARWADRGFGLWAMELRSDGSFLGF